MKFDVRLKKLLMGVGWSNSYIQQMRKEGRGEELFTSLRTIVTMGANGAAPLGENQPLKS